MAESRISWGILGTGSIAHTFAQALAKSRTGQLVAVASRKQATADAFSKEFNSIQAYDSYEKLVADPQVQAIYIGTPHPFHAEWCIRAVRAKKHVLCEKPITMNNAEAMAVMEAARENGVFMMEGFMYRCHPQTAKLVELIRSGAIGRIGLIKATFGFAGHFHSEHRLYKNALGGGAILDVGCYTMSISRLVAGTALGLPFANPTHVNGFVHLHPETETDVYAAALVQFPGGIAAQLANGVTLELDTGLRVFGSTGSLYIKNPFTMGRQGGETTIFLKPINSEKQEEIVVQTSDYLFALEADAVGDALAQGKIETTYMSHADTLGNMAALDAWRHSAKFAYESEKPGFAFPTVTRQPLRKRADLTMSYGAIDGVKLPVSRLVLGCDNQYTMPHAAIMFDDFFERGGNAFDTSYVYFAGLQERLLGRWLQQRGLRSQTVVIVKGAHTPFCSPAFLDSHLRESLDRLQTDYADVYLMHRDNTSIPVGEFVDVLNEHHRAGRIGAFGGSNWSLARLQEANAYAAKKGMRGFNCLSNNFSLARLVSPIWEGCLSCNDPVFKKWLTETKMAVLPWSSQARGFFTDRAHPDKRDNEELVRAWYSDENFKRRERAIELARQKGVEPINIALAYVLHQPFPTFALVGPRAIAETVSTFRALSIHLTPKEIAWLDLECG